MQRSSDRTCPLQSLSRRKRRMRQGMNVIFDFLQQKLCIRAPTLSLFMRYIVSVVSILFTIGLMMICDVLCKNTCWYFLYHSRTCCAISRFWLGWLYIYDLVVHNSLNLSLPYCSCYSSALLHFLSILRDRNKPLQAIHAIIPRWFLNVLDIRSSSIYL